MWLHTGAGAIRMAWGSAQEAASVHALLQVFPDAAVGEVRPASCCRPRARVDCMQWW
jgi:hypothetical protein